jgi:hypothetical protein
VLKETPGIPIRRRKNTYPPMAEAQESISTSALFPRTLYFTDLPIGTIRRHLLDLFRVGGCKVLHLELFPGGGWVMFEEKKYAQHILDYVLPITIDGNPITVVPYEPESRFPINPKILYIGNIPYETTTKELRDGIFTVKGMPSIVKITKESEKGHAFAHFKTPEDALIAWSLVRGRLVEERQIRVNFAQLDRLTTTTTGGARK